VLYGEKAGHGSEGDGMSFNTGKGVYEIIRRTLAMVNRPIIEHGERTGYILYKMLECEYNYTENEMFNYVMIGMLHDIGLYRESNIKTLSHFEDEKIWPHSVTGFEFLKYLSPLGDLAEIVLNHHVPYKVLKGMKLRHSHVIECLSFADKMENYIGQEESRRDKSFFTKSRGTVFSEDSFKLFTKSEEKFGILRKVTDGSYRDELYEFLDAHKVSEADRLAYFNMLVYTIDFRSEATVIHTMSTVNFAQQLGKKLKLSAKELYNLHYGALLHDLGKLSVPIEILESPKRLTDAEMEIMKSHVRITELILDTVVDDEIRDIAARHHEKLDGTGYPRGLTEEELTFPQQIIAVADILSALYCKRSYKESYDSKVIQDIIQKDADAGKISRKAVDCLMKNYDEIIANYEKEKDDTIGIYLMIRSQYDLIIKKFEKVPVKL
jgi:HD-GYP domain-containing protein (c-di-GMP phosphodiesterase class II)